MTELVMDSTSANLPENGNPTAPEHGVSAEQHSSPRSKDLKSSGNEQMASSQSPSALVTYELAADIENDSLQKKAPTMSGDPSPKPNAGPPTPTVKKVIKSGTFGAGAVKPVGTKAVAPRATAPVPKKTTTSAPVATSKPVLASSTSGKPSVNIATSTRRASIVPTKAAAPPSLRPSLSASASAKHASESGAVRSSVASPTGSVASVKAGNIAPSSRPRASLSEGVKKAPLPSRSSVSGSSKAANPAKSTNISRPPAVAQSSKSSKVPGSISSIKEIKEGDKPLEELHSQFTQTGASLEAREAAVSDFEKRIEELRESLAIKSQELERMVVAQVEHQKARDIAELESEETRKLLRISQEELQQVTAALQTVRDELEASKSNTEAQSEIILKLESRVTQLEAELTASKKQTELLEKHGSMAQNSAAEAASINREALLKAQADFEAISLEAQALRLAHAKALQDAENSVAELNLKVKSAEVLEAQVASLKAEKEENANKLSELEVEVLELKEAQEELEDARDQLQRKVAALEDQLANAAVAASSAAEAATQERAAHAEQLEALAEERGRDLEAAAARQSEYLDSIEALRVQHADALAAKEKAEREMSEREKQHALALLEVEQKHEAQRADLESRLEMTSQELRDQESIYNSKIDAVKLQHEQLLQEAFERAKNEAAQTHSHELQELRSISKATIEQIQRANQITIDSLHSEHQSNHEMEVNALQKQISKLSVDLKATQDDLVKAKTSLEASQTEVENLTQQLHAARSQAEASPVLSPEHADEIARLTQELSNTKDDLAALTDMLNFTKSSMTELSDKHAKEMEEVAKARADELINLRLAHDGEVNVLATQKSDLVVRLSDLEGELATVRAALEAQQTASPRRTGNGINNSSVPSGVTKEELTKMHEAHNLKLYDIQAEHERAMRTTRDELEAASARISELQQDLARKTMEIQYLEQDQEENQEQITRLKEDLERLGGHEQEQS